MPSFRFRFEPLLDKKIRDQESAEAVLAERKKELAAEEKTLQNLQREVECLVELHASKRRQMLAHALGSGEQAERLSAFLRGIVEDIASGRAGVLSQKLMVGRGERAVREAHEFVAVCKREVDVLRKYRDKLEAAFNREAARQEERQNDEIGNVLFLARDRKR